MKSGGRLFDYIITNKSFDVDFTSVMYTPKRSRRVALIRLNGKYFKGSTCGS